MKKNILVLFLIILLSGCSNQYDIKITGDKIEETVVSSIDVDEIPKKNQFNIENGIEVDDPVTPFINNDQYPFLNNNEIIYDKNVENTDDSYIVTLKHEYSFDEFRNSKAYNCFEKKSFVREGKNYSIYFSGSFYCMYGDALTINITTDNSVFKHNADKVTGNTYSWTVNKDNMDDFEIEFLYGEDSPETSSNNNIFIFCFIIAFLVLIAIVGGVVIVNKNRKSNEL